MAKFTRTIRLAAYVVALQLITMLMVITGSGGSAQAQQSLLLNKTLCLASALPASPTGNDFASCPNSVTGSMGTLYYYVIAAGNVSGTASGTISDTLPSGFQQVSAPQPLLCTAGSCASVTLTGSGTVSAVVTVSTGATYLVIPGYFNKPGFVNNTAGLNVGSGEVANSHGAYIDPAKPLPGNMAVTKTADITSASLGGGGGSATVNYTITLANTGSATVYLGGLLELVDNVGILPGPPQASSLLFEYAATNPQVTPSTSGLVCPVLTGGNLNGTTTAANTGAILGVWQFPPNSSGQMSPGDSCTYTFEVTYTLSADVVCVWPNTADGVRNSAYIRFANGQGSFSDMAIADNTSAVNLEITDTGVTEECEVPPPPPPSPIKISKVQKDPAANSLVSWGTPVTYVIHVENTGTKPINNVLVTDYLSMLPGMPVFTAGINHITCANPSSICQVVAPSSLPASLTYNANNTQVAAQVNILTLMPGDWQDIIVEVIYEPNSCVSYQTNGPRQTADSANVKFDVPYKPGISFHYDLNTPPVITDHDKVQACTLKVSKKGPKQITYGNWFSYTVNFENYGANPIAVGTLMDAISLDSSTYATSVSGVYDYGCKYYSPASSTVAQSWPAALANLLPGLSGSNPVSISYHQQPEQGTRLIHNLNPAAPITLPANSRVECIIRMKLNQPASAPYCQGDGKPKLVNSALMDVTHYYNTNLNPHTNAYAATSASLPLCNGIDTGKSITPIITPPGQPGQSVQVTLSLANLSSGAINGAKLVDNFQIGLVPQATPAPVCSPACTGPVSVSGQNVTGTFSTLNGNTTGTITLSAIANGPAPKVYKNEVMGYHTPPQGNWYNPFGDPNVNPPKAFVGVFDLVDLKIEKTVINTSGSPFPAGPFPMTVSCQLPMAVGETSVVTYTTFATANPPAAVVSGIPSGSVCTVTETSVPAGTNGFGFNSVGYSPQGNGMNAQVTVDKALDNIVYVENCYGPPSSSPLTTWHEPGKDCPPVIKDPPPEFKVTKVCGPAYLQPDDTFLANCTVTVVASGPAAGPVIIQEDFSPSSGNLQFTGSTPYNWSCSPANLALPGSMNCTLPGGSMNASGGFVSTLNFLATFGRGEDPTQHKNCAILSYDGVQQDSCVGFEVVKDPVKTDISKKCTAPYFDKVPGEWKANCDIYVTVTGPIAGNVTVSDVLQSAPNGTAEITALTAAGWACTPNLPIPVGQALTCTMPGANFAASGQSVINAEVTLYKDEKEFKNCASLTVGDIKTGPSCDGGVVTTPIDFKIEKICKPLFQVPGAATLQARCRITVTASAQPTGPVTVNDVLSATGAAGQVTFIGGTGWSCVPSTAVPAGQPMICTNAAFPASLTSSFYVTVSYPLGSTSINSQNCATVAYDGVTKAEDCADIKKETSPPSISATKTCELYQQATDTLATYLCTITVSATGTPLPPLITLSDIFQNAGSTYSGLYGFGSQDPWLCPPGTGTAMTSANCTINGSDFPASGVSTLYGLVLSDTPPGMGNMQNCVSASGNSVPPISSEQVCVPIGPQVTPSGMVTVTKKLSVPQGANLTGVDFPVSVTCGGSQNSGMINVNSPYTATGLPLAGTCTVSENLSALPTTGICPGNGVGTWSATYSPAQPVTPTIAGTTVEITNKLTCTPAIYPFDVKKVVVNNAPMPISNLTYGIVISCPGRPSMNVMTYNLSANTAGSGGSVLNDVCTITEPQFPATTACGPTMTPVWSKTIVPPTLTVGTSNPTVVVTNTLNCVGTGNGRLTVKKLVQYAGPSGVNLSGLTFPVTVTCSGVSQSGNISTSAPLVLGNLSTGNACTVSEGTPPTTGVCPAGYSASWTNAMSPTTPVMPTAAGAMVTITNTLNCNPTPQVITLDKAGPTSCADGETCTFTITITNTGAPVNQTISLADALGGHPDSTMWQLVSVQPQVCGGQFSGNNFGCVINLNLGTNQSVTYTVNMIAHWAGSRLPNDHVTNCAAIARAPTGALVGSSFALPPSPNIFVPSSPDFIAKDCVDVNFEQASTLGAPSVTKTCRGGIYTNGTMTTPNSCVITVGNAAPGVATVRVTELLNDADPDYTPPSAITSFTAPNWTCSPVPVQSEAAATCTIPAATLALGGSSTINMQIFSSDPGSVIELSNCVRVEGLDAAGNVVTASQLVCANFPAPPPNIVVDPNCGNGTVRLANGKCGIAPPVTPRCDRETTRLVDGKCLCTIRGMQPVSKTQCACPKGQELRNGRCRDVPPPPPPAPKCDPRSTVLQGGKCVCKVPGAVPVSKTACECPDGTELIKGKCRVPAPEVKCDPRSAVPSNGKCVCKVPGAVPVSPTACECPDGTELIRGKCRVPAPVLKCDLETAVPKQGQCVCKFRGMRPVSETECACRRGASFVPGKGCVTERVECPEGTILKGDRCVRPKSDEPREQETCPPGTVLKGKLCVRVRKEEPQQPDGAGKSCLDREGKEIPCD